MGYRLDMGQREHASSLINAGAVRLIRAGFADSGMTQDALARACGIPRSTLANILSPTADPRLIHVEQMVKIAVALGVDPRTWVGELESIARKQLVGADEVADRRRARGSATPEVQKRAARSKASKPRLGKE
jgi:transcriptional regulator with XRE-family HTH domain